MPESWPDRLSRKYEEVCVRFMGFSPMTPDMKEGESLKNYSSRALNTFVKVIAWLICFHILTITAAVVLVKFLEVLLVKTLGLPDSIFFAIAFPLALASLYIGALCTKRIILKIWPAENKPDSVG